jgi:hypothetical protein
MIAKICFEFSCRQNGGKKWDYVHSKLLSKSVPTCNIYVLSLLLLLLMLLLLLLSGLASDPGIF